MNRSAALLLLALGGRTSSPLATSLYFPELASRARALEPAAMEQILALSGTTPPGERLEELAEMAAAYVRPAPAVFLRAQGAGPGCFGVSFLGPNFVDNPRAREEELAARQQALASIAAPDLAGAKARCLAELAGS
jgi:hypothetical protein